MEQNIDYKANGFLLSSLVLEMFFFPILHIPFAWLLLRLVTKTAWNTCPQEGSKGHWKVT